MELRLLLVIQQLPPCQLPVHDLKRADAGLCSAGGGAWKFFQAVIRTHTSKALPGTAQCAEISMFPLIQQGHRS